MSRPTIVIIGAGSVQWMPDILTDIALTPVLHGSKLVLHDIDEAALAMITALAPRIFERAQANFVVESTIDLSTALSDADYVILTISVGGLNAMNHDLAVPRKYGIAQSVGDTTGPGGLARALRNIPIVVGIAKEMESVCPQAWLLNYTNPMSSLCRAVTKTTSIKTIGLCHELFGTLQFLRTIFAIDDPADLQYSVAGINHLIWIVELTIRGDDGFELLRRYIRDKGTFAHVPAKLPGTVTSVFADRQAVKLELFEAFGALPAVNDRHIAEFFPYFLSEEAGFGLKYGVELTTIAHRQERVCKQRNSVRAKAEGIEKIPLKKSKEALADILAALTTRKDAVHILNLPNQGQLGDLPAGVVVETLGVVGAQGARGLTVGDLPAGVRNTLIPHVLVQELTVDAALTGNRQLALQALLTDPLTVRKYLDAKAMLDELLTTNAQYLPQFFD